MTINKFKTFLEQTEDTKYRILVVSAERSENDKLFRTAQRFKEEAEKAGHEIYVAQVEGAFIGFHEGVYKIYNQDDKKGFVIDRENTVAFVRGSVRLKKSYLDLLSRLEKTGVTMVNSREVVEISSDKYRTYVKLQDFGLTQPRTALIPNKDGWRQAFDSIDLKYPCIMKTLEGSKGIGVLFIESERQMDSIVQLLYNQNPEIDLLLQEYIKTEGDIRVIILGGKIIASMKRSVIEGDFRSNVSRGAKVKEYEMTELEIEESLKASKAIDGSWTAVDFIPSKNPKTEPPYILEVNHSPGTKGIEEATGKNIVSNVIEHFANPNNRYPVSTQCGFIEVVNIKPFGELIAKFDTGNGASAPTIHADNIDVKGNSITWTLNNKTITSKIVKVSNVDVGGLNNYSEKRYTVVLDFEFEGTNYTNNFMIDDREDRTPVLLNRKILRMLNVAVNPSRKYIATTKYSVEE